MFPYIVFIAVLLYYYAHKRPKYMLWTIIIFAVMRYNVGWDYISYVETVNTPKLWTDADISRFSFIWRDLFRLAYIIKSPHIAIIAPNVLTYLCIYWGLKRLNLSRREMADALFVYATWNSFYLGSFSTIRQACAMAVGFLMFAYIQNHKLIKSLFCYLFAIILHPSAAILIFLYLGYWLRNRLNIKWLFICAICLVLGLLAISELLNALSIIEMPDYEKYLNQSDSYGGKIIFVNAFMTIYLLTVFFFDKKINLMQRQCFFYTLIAFIGNLSIYIVGLTNIVERILLYYQIYMIVILLPSLNIFAYKRNLRISATALLSLYFFVYLYITLSATDKGIGSSGYVPYHCILFN